jgi:hypothetical protein
MYSALESATSDPDCEQVVENLKSEWSNACRWVCCIPPARNMHLRINYSQGFGSSRVSVTLMLFLELKLSFQGNRLLVHDRFTIPVQNRSILPKGDRRKQHCFIPGVFVCPLVFMAILSLRAHGVYGTVTFFLFSLCAVLISVNQP